MRKTGSLRNPGFLCYNRREVIALREIKTELITETVERLCIDACTMLGEDMKTALRKAESEETAPAARAALNDIVRNFECAACEGLPICQDTGMAVVFADIGQDAHISGSFEDAVNEGVRRGYINGCLRKSVVADPFRRVNTGDNTPAVIHTHLVEGDRLTLTVAPKGFGSENKSALKMLLPSAPISEFEDFIVDTVARAGGDPCPPIVLGVAIGGTVEACALAAKRQLARPISEINPDPFYADMEERLLERINALGIGPQGFGGKTTCLKVNVAALPCHIAGTPCVVNVGCHATRHASATI